MEKVRCKRCVGVYEYANGDNYDGFWSNNRKHGQGFIF